MYLPPREIVDVRLVFKPPKPNERVHRADIAMAGDLRVTYQNGDVQVGLQSGLSSDHRGVSRCHGVSCPGNSQRWVVLAVSECLNKLIHSSTAGIHLRQG